VQSRPIPQGVARKSDTPADKAKWAEKEKTVERAIAAEVLKKLWRLPQSAGRTREWMSINAIGHRQRGATSNMAGENQASPQENAHRGVRQLPMLADSAIPSQCTG
jgi:hypothetical protein